MNRLAPLTLFAVILTCADGCRSCKPASTVPAVAVERRLEDLTAWNLDDYPVLAWVRKEAARDEPRYLAIRGMGLTIPGVPEGTRAYAFGHYLLVPAPSDSVRDEQEQRVLREVNYYAWQFNREMASLISGE